MNNALLFNVLLKEKDPYLNTSIVNGTTYGIDVANPTMCYDTKLIHNKPRRFLKKEKKKVVVGNEGLLRTAVDIGDIALSFLKDSILAYTGVYVYHILKREGYSLWVDKHPSSYATILATKTSIGYEKAKNVLMPMPDKCKIRFNDFLDKCTFFFNIFSYADSQNKINEQLKYILNAETDTQISQAIKDLDVVVANTINSPKVINAFKDIVNSLNGNFAEVPLFTAFTNPQALLRTHNALSAEGSLVYSAIINHSYKNRSLRIEDINNEIAKNIRQIDHMFMNQSSNLQTMIQNTFKTIKTAMARFTEVHKYYIDLENCMMTGMSRLLDAMLGEDWNDAQDSVKALRA